MKEDIFSDKLYFIKPAELIFEELLVGLRIVRIYQEHVFIVGANSIKIEFHKYANTVYVSKDFINELKFLFKSGDKKKKINRVLRDEYYKYFKPETKLVEIRISTWSRSITEHILSLP